MLGRRRRTPPDTLTCPGVFAVDLPADWTIAGTPGAHYELAPAPGGPDVAVVISVEPLTDEVAGRGPVELLRWLADSGDDTPTGFSATTAAQSDGDRAFGRWNVGERTWFGGAMFARGVVVIASSNSRYGDSVAFRLGEQLVAGIRPV